MLEGGAKERVPRYGQSNDVVLMLDPEVPPQGPRNGSEERDIHSVYMYICIYIYTPKGQCYNVYVEDYDRHSGAMGFQGSKNTRTPCMGLAMFDSRGLISHIWIFDDGLRFGTVARMLIHFASCQHSNGENKQLQRPCLDRTEFLSSHATYEEVLECMEPPKSLVTGSCKLVVECAGIGFPLILSKSGCFQP